MGYKISKKPEFANKTATRDEEEEPGQSPSARSPTPEQAAQPGGEPQQSEQEDDAVEDSDDDDQVVKKSTKARRLSKASVNCDKSSSDEDEDVSPHKQDPGADDRFDAVPADVVERPASPDSITDPLQITEGFYTWFSKYCWGVSADYMRLQGVPMDLPDGRTLGNVRVSRSYEQWAPFVRPKNIFIIDDGNGISYMYVIMRVPSSDERTLAVDSRRLRHVPSVVAIKIVQELRKKSANWGEAQLAKYAPVLAYEETENQQIEPKAAKWVPYKKIKSLLSAEESHEPVPRKKKEKRRAARNDDDHESIDEGEAPTLALLGAVGVKRFKVPPGIKAKLLQLNRHVYVVLQEDPIAALAERS